MAMEFTTGGNVLTPYRPIPGRVHPQEGSLAHIGTLVKGPNGRIIGVCDEEIRKRHRRLVSSRSVNAKATASGKVERFVKTQGDTDRTLDAAPVVSPLSDWQFTPKRVGTRKLRTAVRSLRS